MITGQFVMNATASLVDRSEDRWSVSCFADFQMEIKPLSSRYRRPIGREKGVRAFVTPLNALPLFTHPKGGPGGVFVLFGVPPFQGMVHEGSCAFRRGVGRVMLDHKGLEVRRWDGSF